jgi:hypothetical protein
MTKIRFVNVNSVSYSAFREFSELRHLYINVNCVAALNFRPQKQGNNGGTIWGNVARFDST